MNQELQLQLLKHVGRYVRKRVTGQLKPIIAHLSDTDERFERLLEQVERVERRNARLAAQIKHLQAKVETETTS